MSWRLKIPRYSEEYMRRRESFWRERVHYARPANVLYLVREPDPYSIWVEPEQIYFH